MQEIVIRMLRLGNVVTELDAVCTSRSILSEYNVNYVYRVRIRLSAGPLVALAVAGSCHSK